MDAIHYFDDVSEAAHAVREGSIGGPPPALLVLLHERSCRQHAQSATRAGLKAVCRCCPSAVVFPGHPELVRLVDKECGSWCKEHWEEGGEIRQAFDVIEGLGPHHAN